MRLVRVEARGVAGGELWKRAGVQQKEGRERKGGLCEWQERGVRDAGGAKRPVPTGFRSMGTSACVRSS